MANKFSKGALMTIEKNPPRCDTCIYVLPSYTSGTGLRCGLEYARANALVRKLRKMDFYPIVKADNACESWKP